MLAIHPIYQRQQLLIGGDVTHRIAVMDEAHHAIFVHQYLGRHAAEFE